MLFLFLDTLYTRTVPKIKHFCNYLTLSPFKNVSNLVTTSLTHIIIFDT
uniref:Uncharacterized protein n=1 Tax=Anguilla anguilla TaxID=7936 RepID=A0A0E9Q2A1_ANGAN